MANFSMVFLLVSSARPIVLQIHCVKHAGLPVKKLDNAGCRLLGS